MPRVRIRSRRRISTAERIRLGLLVGGALVAGAAIFAVNIAADTSVIPEFASRADPGNSDALTGMAQDSASADLSAAKDYALKAITLNPLDDRAQVLVALAATSTNNIAQADSVFSLVTHMTRRQPLAETWMFDIAADRGDYATAIDHADAALRRQGGNDDEVMTVLIQSTDSAAALPPLARKLVSSPPWRQNFFDAFARSPVGNAPALFAAMRRAGGNATPLETAGMATQQITAGKLQGARSVWQMGFGKPLPVLIAPHFESDQQFGDFGWSIAARSGATIVRRGGNRGRALQIQLSNTGKKALRVAQQAIFLDSGRFVMRFEGRGLLGDNHPVASVVVRCAGTDTELGRASIPSAKPWQQVAFAFTVPATDCPIQKLVIEADPNLGQGGSPALVSSFDVR